MLRRVLAERDGGMIAVTLMSSDMGKLYAALAQAVDKRGSVLDRHDSSSARMSSSMIRSS